MVFGKSPSQRSESNRWRADGIRVENVPRIHYGDSKNYDRTTVWTWAVQRQDHLHVNVQRHCVGRTRKHRRVWENFTHSSEICSQIPARTLVIFGTWRREEMVRNLLWFPDGKRDKTAEQMMLNLAESSHPMFRATSALERGEWRSREEGKKSLHFNGSEEKHWTDSSHGYFCKSAQYLRSSSRSVQRTVQKFQSFRETWCKRIFGNSGNTYRTFYCWSSHRRRVAGKSAARLWTKIRATSWRPEIIQTVLRRWFEDCWKRTVLHHTWRRRRTKWNEESLLRVYIASKWRSIPSERVDSRKHENRPSLGCEGLLSSRTLRYWSHDRVRIVNGKHKFVTETSETISLEKRWARSYKETCCESKATTKACCDTVSHFYSSSWKKMDRHQSRKIPWLLFCSVKNHDQIPTTSSINSSRRWWSSTIWRDMKEFKAKFDGTSQWPIDEWISFLAKGGGPKKRFQYCLNPYSSKKKSCTSQQFKDIQEVMLLIMHCKTMYCRRTSPSTSTTCREYKWNAFNNQTLTTEYLAYPILQLDTRHESQRHFQKVDSAVREPPEQGVFPAVLE